MNNTALYSGYYADLFPYNNLNIYAFFRAAANNRIVVIMNMADQNSKRTIPLLNVRDVSQSDKNAMPDGTVFNDIANMGATASISVTNGGLSFSIPANTIAVYKQQ